MIEPTIRHEADGVTLWHADAAHLPLEDDSVDLVVTSPPYFALRSYQDDGEHYDGQIGSEPTPTEFLDALVACTAEMRRVLKPTGSIFVNLGDKYGDKSLMGMPWRYAIRCIDEIDLILRAEIIWAKPNSLPESVTDRVRRSHEQWFHFTKEPRYFTGIDEIREAHSGGSHHGRKDKGESPRNTKLAATGDHGSRKSNTDPDLFNPLGKLPGSVWSIPSEPLKVPEHIGVDHYAAYPQEWPRRLITGFSPTGICVECGEARVAEVVTEQVPTQATNNRSKTSRNDDNGWAHEDTPRTQSSTTVTGYSCACPTPDAPTRPAVVLDPFGGTGTTAMVARALGRHVHHIDLSHDYLRLAQWRIWESGHAEKREKARVSKWKKEKRVTYLQREIDRLERINAGLLAALPNKPKPG